MKEFTFIIVAGGRKFDNLTQVYKLLDQYISFKEITNPFIIHGNARGADKMGESYAKSRNIPYKAYPAPWNDIKGKPDREIGVQHSGTRYWKLAGHHRNQQMADIGDHLVVFWNGESTGSWDMINRANKAGLQVHIFRVEY